MANLLQKYQADLFGQYGPLCPTTTCTLVPLLESHESEKSNNPNYLLEVANDIESVIMLKGDEDISSESDANVIYVTWTTRTGPIQILRLYLAKK